MAILFVAVLTGAASFSVSSLVDVSSGKDIDYFHNVTIAAIAGAAMFVFGTLLGA